MMGRWFRHSAAVLIPLLLAGCAGQPASSGALEPTPAHLLAIFAWQMPVMLLLPLAIGWFIRRRFGAGWAAFGWGALTFILSQVGHIPANYAIGLAGSGQRIASWPLAAIAIVAGLSSGVFEEGARWLVLRFLARRVRGWRAGLQYGAGHGGIESIILGALVLLNIMSLLASGAIDLNAAGLPAATAEQIRAAQAVYWGTPPYMYLLAGVERILTITVHIAMASLVMRAVVRSRIIYLLASILFHTALNAWAVWGAQQTGPVGVEAGAFVFALFALWVIWILREPPAVEEGPRPLAPTVIPTAAQLRPRELSEEDLARRVDSSRYE